MKKIAIFVGFLLISTLLLSGCNESEGELEEKENDFHVKVRVYNLCYGRLNCKVTAIAENGVTYKKSFDMLKSSITELIFGTSSQGSYNIDITLEANYIEAPNVVKTEKVELGKMGGGGSFMAHFVVFGIWSESSMYIHGEMNLDSDWVDGLINNQPTIIKV